MRVKDAVGRFGEQVAVDHLEAAGLRVLARNWRCSDGELDAVAAEGTTLVFVEVKTRSGVGFGQPAEAVTYRKLARLRRLAVRWMLEHRDIARQFPDVRFDVVSVLRSRGTLQVEHVRAVTR